MRAHVLVVAMLSAWLSVWSACAVTDDVTEPAASARESPPEVIFEEPFDELVPGPIGGQNKWDGNCTVTGGSASKYLECRGGQSASRGLGLHGAGDFTFGVDLSSNINVVDSTHSKIWLEGPQGRVFQIVEGCDNIRVAFQMSGPTVVLASFPCQSVSGRTPRFRVVCHWAGGGTTLSCGAARLPGTPTDFIDLALPSGVRPFDRLSIAAAGTPGASVFDNISVEHP
jgi:hypothetical protein